MPVKKMSQIEIDAEAKRIAQEYAYMDGLSLEGWIWEFIRRSEAYQKDCERLKKMAEKKIFFTTKEIDECFHNFHIEYNLEIGMDRYTAKWASHYIILREDKTRKAAYIPKPDIFDFKRPKLFHIVGTEAYKIVADASTEFEKYQESSKKKSPWMHFVLNLAAIDPDNTIYVGIAKTAKPNDLRDKLLPELRTLLTETKRARIRDDKWKYYLICYDLKKKFPNCTFDNVADVLQKAYPSIQTTIRGTKRSVASSGMFDAKNTERYCELASDLIKEKYKHHLHELP